MCTAESVAVSALMQRYRGPPLPLRPMAAADWYWPGGSTLLLRTAPPPPIIVTPLAAGPGRSRGLLQLPQLSNTAGRGGVEAR